MAYTVEITPAAHRLAKKFPKSIRKVIVNQAKWLARQPYAGKKLRGKFSFLYSCRFHHQGVSYRIIYEVSKKDQRLIVHLAASRENLYRRLSEMRVKRLLGR